MIWLHRYATLVAAASLVLIVAGGLVTSTGSGLAVPDWPTSYGYFMFSFPFSNMVGGILYEHGHRLIASTVGVLTVLLAAGVWRVDPRRWVKWLAVTALAAVVLQGILGGVTVLYFLPAPVSISHAGLAQIFFGLVVSLALFTSPGWLGGYRAAGPGGRDSAPPVTDDTDDMDGMDGMDGIDDQVLRRLAMATSAIIYVQILIGATMRHTGAGLAIPDFPLAFGRVVPPDWNQAIFVHFAHRVGALVTLAAILTTSGHVWAHHRSRKELTHPALLLVALVASQIALGGWTVLSGKAVAVNTAHVATGALVFVTSLVLMLRAHHGRFPGAALLTRATGVARATLPDTHPPVVSSPSPEGRV